MATVNTECIREEMATLVSFSQSPINPNKAILIRRWSLTDPNEASIAAADLRLRQSIINNADEKCHTVESPMAGQVQYPGVYRGAGVKLQTNGNTYFIDQTLSLGLLTELDPTDCVISDSSLLPGNSSGSGDTASDNPEAYITMSLEGVDPDYVLTILGQINSYNWNDAGLAFTTQDGVVISGQYHFITSKTKKELDETVTIDFILARPQFTLNAYNSYLSSTQEDVIYLWNVPKAIAQTVMDGWKLIANRTATASYRDAGLVDIILATKNNTDQTASLGGTSDQHLDTAALTEDTTVHTAAVAPLADVPFTTQGTITETRNYPNEDGTFKTSLRTVVSKELEVAESETAIDKFKISETIVGKNLKDPKLASDYDLAATPGEVQARRVTRNDDGTYDSSRERTTASTVAAAETTSEIRAFEKTVRVIDRNNVTGDSIPVAQVAGSIVTVSNKTNEFDRVDVVVDTRMATAASSVTKETTATAFHTSARVSDRNQTSVIPDVLTQQAGTIKTARKELNDFGVTDQTLETKTATPVASTDIVTSVTAFQEERRQTDRNQVAAAAEETTLVPGEVTVSSSSLNEFGVFDNVTDVKTAVPQTITYTSISSRLVDETTDKEWNATNKMDASGGGVGVSVQVSSTLNEFGLYDNVRQTKTAPAEIAEDRSSSTTEFVDELSVTRRSELTIVPDETIHVNGEITQVRGVVNEFGLYDNTTDVKTSKTVTLTYDSVSSPLGDEETIKEWNADAKMDASGGVAGTVVRVSSSVNEFGKFDNVKQTTTAPAVALEERASEVTEFVTDLAVTSKGETTPVADETIHTNGMVKSARSRINELGLYDNTQETKTSHDTTDTFNASLDFHKDVSITVERNASTIPVAAAAVVGTVQKVSAQRNEFGKYDANKETITGHDYSISAYAAGKSFNENTYTWESFRNAAVPPSLGADYGEVRYEKNELGLYDGYKKVETQGTGEINNGSYFPYTDQTSIDVVTQGTQGQEYYRKVTSTYDFGYYLTQGAALHAISGGLNGSSSGNVATNVWFYKKVKNIHLGPWVIVPRLGKDVS